jgi:adenine-specific DNA-methyltransferase
VIYIDPPYNTGNEGWAYNDNVNAPALKEWLGKVVDAEDMERHDKWLAMMWPRLQLLRELLASDGVLFVSIDDNEAASLALLLDEVFTGAERPFTFIWRKVDSPNDNKVPITPDHEYVITVTPNAERVGFRPMSAPAIIEAYGQTAEDGRRYRDRLLKKNGRNSLRRDRPTMFFPVTDPDGGEVYPIHETGEEACWAMSQAGVTRKREEGLLIWKKREKLGKAVWEPYTREFAPTEPTRPYPTIWSDLPTMRQAKAMLRDIFGTTDLFATPKPTQLIERILQTIDRPDALVLDSFAGSGTTAQAVLAMNKRDGGNRRFILVETEDYADTLTAERVRRVIKGVAATKDEVLRNGLGGSFTYCELGDEMNLERFFAGDGSAPAWDRLAEYVAYTATGGTLTAEREGPDGFAGEAADFRLHLIYRPDQAWMRSNEAMLDMPMAERIATAAAGQPVLVFAAGKFMAQKVLTGMGLTFCQLPYSIHRILGDGSEGVEGVDAA